MILGSHVVPRRGTDSLLYFHDATSVFSLSIAATTGEETRYWGVCAVFPIRFYHLCCCHSPV